MDAASRIVIAGQNGFVERALKARLQEQGHGNVRFSAEENVDLTDPTQVRQFFHKNPPDYVFLFSVRSGGIKINQEKPAEFIRANLLSQANVIHSAWESAAQKLMFCASSCVYPRECVQPMRESDLWSGPLEETSAAYATAKLAGIRQCQAYRRQYGFKTVSLIPATIYGPGEDTNPDEGHVLGTLMRKFERAAVEKAEKVEVWGSGKPRREFLFIDDFVTALLFLADHYDESDAVNVGCGEDVTIRELAALLARVTGFRGETVFDASRPDGAMQKRLDSRRINDLGWRAQTLLEDGVVRTYEKRIKGLED